MEAAQGDRREGGHDAGVGLHPARRQLVRVVRVEPDLLVGEAVLDALEDPVEEPDVAVGHRRSRGVRVPLAAVEGSAALVLAEPPAVVGAEADPGPLGVLLEVVDDGGRGPAHHLGMADAELPAHASPVHQGEQLGLGLHVGRRQQVDAVGAGEPVAAEALPAVPGQGPRHRLQVAGGEGGEAHGPLQGGGHRRPAGHHRAQLPGHVPAAAELLQQLVGGEQGAAGGQPGQGQPVRRHLQDEGGAVIAAGPDLLLRRRAQVQADAHGHQAVGRRALHHGKLDAAHQPQVVPQLARGQFLVLVGVRRQHEGGQGLPAVDQGDLGGDWSAEGGDPQGDGGESHGGPPRGGEARRRRAAPRRPACTGWLRVQQAAPPRVASLDGSTVTGAWTGVEHGICPIRPLDHESASGRARASSCGAPEPHPLMGTTRYWRPPSM